LQRLWIFNFGHCGCRKTAVEAVINGGGTHYAHFEKSTAQVSAVRKVRRRLCTRQEKFPRTLWFAGVKGCLCPVCRRDTSEPHRCSTERGKHVTVKELTAAFLDHVAAAACPKTYSHYRVIVLDFVDKLYGDNTPVEDFKPGSLKLVRVALGDFSPRAPTATVFPSTGGYGFSWIFFCRILFFPVGLRFDHDVQNGDQFSHRSNQSDLILFSCVNQPVEECFERMFLFRGAFFSP